MKRDLVLGRSFAALVASVLLSMLARKFVKSNKKSMHREADDTDASSSSAASAGNNSYDVFLSFSGKDTRRTFTDHLYKGLVGAGICVFRDNMLPEGEKIGINLFQAIKNSKISIPILSPNYALSEWCLEELVEMTECIKSGHVVLPIFYHVEPTHVRNQKGSFGKTFSRLSSNYVKEDVAKWKQALQKVASLKGWEPEKTADGLEGDLVEMVVRKVLSELKKAFQPVVTEQLVGIDKAVEDIFRLLDDNPSVTQIIGIYGMGGIGKTTLAKVVHKKLSDQFRYHSFILDIRESSRRNGIFYLQNQLISDLKGEGQVSNIDAGIRTLESRFKRKKVLILLDDVDDIEQIRALVGKYDWFEMGSRIIITTRSRSVLDKADVKCKHKLEEMAEDESLVLFSRHAFRKDSPPCEFESLSRAVVSTTGGLPLALEVIGSYLCGQSSAFYEDALKQLQKVPHMKVQEKLRISYDALDWWVREIFLDIACLFIGTDLTYAFYMWDACNFFPKVGIETLSFMSLIKIGDHGKVQMHDQLRDLGREIVRQEDCNMPMNRSRLWVREEALEALERNKGNKKDCIQALCLEEDGTKGWTVFDYVDSRVKFTTEQFEALLSLRFLKVRHAKMTGDSRSLLPELRWLMWRGRDAFVATNFCLKKLVILNLSESDISGCWEGWSHLKMAEHLKVLDLKNCQHLEVTPDLSAFQNLEIFQLEACWNLKQIHPSIGKTKNLVLLNLKDCHKLRELPPEMNKLEELKELYIGDTAIVGIPPCHLKMAEHLKVLDLKYCRHLKVTPDLSACQNLEILQLKSCWNLKQIHPSIGKAKNLVFLDLEGCHKLQEVPREINKLEELKELYVGNTAIVGIPPCIGSLKKLEVLNAAGCKSLVGLPDSIGHLVNLKFFHIALSNKLSNLPSTISKLGNLEELDASQCNSLGGEIHVDGLASLKILQLSGTGVSGFHGTFDKLSSLEKIKLDYCKMLQSLPELPTSLTVLEVSGQHCTFPQLSHLIHLRKLSVKSCPLLKSMPKLPLRLLALFVWNCGELKELPSLSRLEFLSYFSLDGCGELTEIRGLEGLKSLARLIVTGCSKLSNLDGLEHLKSLRWLRLWTSGPILKDDQVRRFEKLKDLEELHVVDCESLVRVDVSQLTHLKHLAFLGCCNLLEIKGLERLKNLRMLQLVGCPPIDTLPDLSCFHNPPLLYVDERSNIPDVRGVRKARYLGRGAILGEPPSNF